MFNFIIGLVVGIGIMWVIKRSPSTSSGNNPNTKGMEEKRENLESVMEMAKEKGEITNNDVEHALGVSNATAERYLQELESQDKLTQVGETGQSVRYRLK